MRKKTMEESKWITREQMLEALHNDADNEHEYRRHLGGILSSTHWLIYDSRRGKFGDSTDWKHYSWFTESEFLEDFGGGLWKRDN